MRFKNRITITKKKRNKALQTRDIIQTVVSLAAIVCCAGIMTGMDYKSLVCFDTDSAVYVLEDPCLKDVSPLMGGTYRIGDTAGVSYLHYRTEYKSAIRLNKHYGRQLGADFVNRLAELGDMEAGAYRVPSGYHLEAVNISLGDLAYRSAPSARICALTGVPLIHNGVVAPDETHMSTVCMNRSGLGYDQIIFWYAIPNGCSTYSLDFAGNCRFIIEEERSGGDGLE